MLKDNDVIAMCTIYTAAHLMQVKPTYESQP